MKRIALILIACFLLFASAPVSKAEPGARFLLDVYTFPYGVEANVSARAAEGGEYELKTGEGILLATAKAGGSGSRITFRFIPTRRIPKQTVLKLTYAGKEETLCETLLFCDELQNGGIKRVDTREKKLAITFDAAINDMYTLQIMDILEQYDAHCTFFVIGKFPEAHPELCRQMIERGHELASHSYEHLEMGEASSSEAYQSLLKADQQIRIVNGDKPVLYRPPSGISTFRDRAVAHGLGSEVILWEVDSGDGFAEKTLEEVLRRVKKGLHGGGIVLMHVYGGTTLYALQELLPYYTGQGYQFVTVSDLLLKEESFIDSSGTQRLLLRDENLLSEAFLSRLQKSGDNSCGNGHAYVNGFCKICGGAEPVKIRGNGNGVLKDLGTEGSLYRAKFRYTDSQLFTVRETDADGNQVLLISNRGNYSGSVPLYGKSPYSLEITTGGSWSAEIEPAGFTDAQSFSGRGDTVTDLTELKSGQYRFTHDGKSNFIVRMLTSEGETVLFSLTGDCDETVGLSVPDGSRTAFAVTADGRWSITPVHGQP